MAANEDAAASRRNFLRSGARAALAGVAGAGTIASATAQTDAISPELERLIEAQQLAYADIFAADAAAFKAEKRSFRMKKDAGLNWRKPNRAIEEASGETAAELALTKAYDRHRDSLKHLSMYPCQTTSDIRVWARYLAEFNGALNKDGYVLALRTLAGLPTEEWEA